MNGESTAANKSEKLLTIGEIATALNVPNHRVTYAIRCYRIVPTQRAGIIRLFDSTKVERIKSAVSRIASGKGGVLA